MYYPLCKEREVTLLQVKMAKTCNLVGRISRVKMQTELK